MTTTQCPICRSDAHEWLRAESFRHDREAYECVRCGQYEITRRASRLKNLIEVHAASISGWLYDQQLHDAIPLLDSRRLESIATLSIPTLGEKGNRLLKHAAKKAPAYTDTFTIDERFVAAIYANDVDEVKYVFKMLQEEGYIQPYRSLREAEHRISPKGHMHIERLLKEQGEGKIAFVAMSFNPDLKPVYDDAIEPAIRHAGYEPLRVDQKEHSNKIDDEIIAGIRRCKFLVADYTQHKHGVYYEEGFAYGLGKNVIRSCCKKDMKNLHFDIRQYNCIDWRSRKELRERLQKRIEAVIGIGPLSM